MAVKPSVPPRRPRPQNDAALLEAVRAHWREAVGRARPVDSTARLDLDADNTAGLDPEAVVVKLDLDADNTAGLDPETVVVKPSAPPRWPGQQGDAALHESGRAHWREVVRRARPVDNTARLDLDLDNTARLDPETVPVKPSAPPRRPGQQDDAARHEAVRARGPRGEVVRRAPPVDSAARLRRGGR